MKFDTDSDGNISIQDLCQMMHDFELKIDHDGIKSLIEQGDINQDKKISYEDLLNIIGIYKSDGHLSSKPDPEPTESDKETEATANKTKDAVEGAISDALTGLGLGDLLNKDDK
jgi:hypothetical protein